MKRIVIEEHFLTEGFLAFLHSRKAYPRLEAGEDGKGQKLERLWRSPDPSDCTVLYPDDINRLVDLGEGRLREMDRDGIDMQVLSFINPGAEMFDPATGTDLAKKSNDELAKAVRKHPGRLAGFAALAPQDPRGAADELERAVKELGLKGAKINSHVGGEYLDNRKYWIIFEKAQQLGVPIYLHPRNPSPDILKACAPYPALTGSMWGYAIETSLHAMRLILSGVFDQYPGLKIILGHLGEGLPFWLWRMDSRWRRQAAASDPLASKIKKAPSQYVKDNFFVTTSGMFWQPAFMCVYTALGADRILFAVDYPFEANREAVEFMEGISICDIDKEKVYHLNAERLLRL